MSLEGPRPQLLPPLPQYNRIVEEMKTLRREGVGGKGAACKCDFCKVALWNKNLEGGTRPGSIYASTATEAWGSQGRGWDWMGEGDS